jgi:hypothetical protein
MVSNGNVEEAYDKYSLNSVLSVLVENLLDLQRQMPSAHVQNYSNAQSRNICRPSFLHVYEQEVIMDTSCSGKSVRRSGQVIRSKER